jgi:hypothetical protein
VFLDFPFDPLDLDGISTGSYCPMSSSPSSRHQVSWSTCCAFIEGPVYYLRVDADEYNHRSHQRTFLDSSTYYRSLPPFRLILTDEVLCCQAGPTEHDEHLGRRVSVPLPHTDVNPAHGRLCIPFVSYPSQYSRPSLADHCLLHSIGRLDVLVRGVGLPIVTSCFAVSAPHWT